MKQKQNVVEFVSTGPSLQVDRMLLRKLQDGSFWIENEIGEGAQVKSRDLEVLLWRFHQEQF